MNELFLTGGKAFARGINYYSPPITKSLVKRAVSQYDITKIMINQGRSTLKLNLHMFKHTFYCNLLELNLEEQYVYG